MQPCSGNWKLVYPEGSDLRRMQHRMTEMLRVIDAICRRHGLRYWLCSGTLLGAVRHEGYIPWDDDLDIEMMRPDYDRLMRSSPENSPRTWCFKRPIPMPVTSIVTQKCAIAAVAFSKRPDYDPHFRASRIFIDIFPYEKCRFPSCGSVQSHLRTHI